MTTEEKMILVNSLQIDDVNHMEGIIFCILAEKNEYNKKIMNQIGAVDEDIEKYTDSEFEEYFEASKLLEKLVGNIKYENDIFVQDDY